MRAQRLGIRRRSGRLSLAALALTGTTACSLAVGAVALAATKPPHKPGHYGGASSEGQSVTFQVSKSGTSIQSFKTSIGYNGKCGQGGGPGFLPEASRISIKHGSFSIAVKFRGVTPSIPPMNGKITGKFSGSTVNGTVARTGGSGCNGYSMTYRAKWLKS
jgi:hypothetical protein